MAKSSVDDAELRRACTTAVAASGARGEEVTFSIFVAKGRGIVEKLGRLTKPRVLALTEMMLELRRRSASRNSRTQVFASGHLAAAGSSDLISDEMVSKKLTRFLAWNLRRK